MSYLDNARSAAQAAFRVVIGFLFACHGAASLFGVLGGAHGGGTVPTGDWPGWYAAVIELVAGTLVAVGLFTVPAALLSSGAMAYAYFVVHQPDALFPLQNGGESAALYCWSFLLIAVLGSGRWSLDHVLLGSRRADAAPTAPAAEPAAQPRRVAGTS